MASAIEDKGVLIGSETGFEAPKLEGEDDEYRLPLFEQKDKQGSTTFDSLLPMSDLPRRMQVENEGSAVGMELDEEDEFDCLTFGSDWRLSFDGKKEIEQGSRRFDAWRWRFDAWGPRSELPMEILEKEEDAEMMGSDDAAWTPRQYRREWNDLWSGSYGSFDDTTRVPSMRFTKKPPLDYSASPMVTLQVFSVKLAAIRGGLQLPLDVFGTVVMRDGIEHNRNIIFCRKRDNCQTLTKEDPYLVLTGPTRAVILMVSSPVLIQAELKVKGSTGSEDKDLSYTVEPVPFGNTMYSHLLECDCTTKISTLEFTLGHIVHSVEATIFVRVIQGSWPDGLRGKFDAFTTCYEPEADLNQKKIILLDSGGEKITYSGNNGEIELSWSVVSVEITGSLKISVEALKGDGTVAKRTRTFKPARYGAKRYKFRMGFCELIGQGCLVALVVQACSAKRSCLNSRKEGSLTGFPSSESQ
ncbi:hypothetical protein PR202_gb21859 [Eleusine coracana subsp. coracana]|uniref:DUF6598 domain-containing protein n=1 Tax=Eleusine coracana subsp. coracana TaxID=191504 RepID=A0AAV5FFV8_ELECO|nr:hypothetical protein PR202_gb21859 [Eleusine coracana subsp. coracana]